VTGRGEDFRGRFVEAISSDRFRVNSRSSTYHVTDLLDRLFDAIDISFGLLTSEMRSARMGDRTRKSAGTIRWKRGLRLPRGVCVLRASSMHPAPAFTALSWVYLARKSDHTRCCVGVSENGPRSLRTASRNNKGWLYLDRGGWRYIDKILAWRGDSAGGTVTRRMKCWRRRRVFRRMRKCCSSSKPRANTSCTRISRWRCSKIRETH
jgi:hypothetical protein